MKLICAECKDETENWVCLKCGGVFCSRYVNEHMVKHNEANPDHCVALSFCDLSFWCCEIERSGF